MQVAVVALIVVVALGILALLVGLLPTLSVDGGFMQLLDSGIALLIRFLDGARWFLPLDVFMLCFAVLLVVDNWSILSRIVQYIVKLIRG